MLPFGYFFVLFSSVEEFFRSFVRAVRKGGKKHRHVGIWNYDLVGFAGRSLLWPWPRATAAVRALQSTRRARHVCGEWGYILHSIIVTHCTAGAAGWSPISQTFRRRREESAEKMNRGRHQYTHAPRAHTFSAQYTHDRRRSSSPPCGEPALCVRRSSRARR